MPSGPSLIGVVSKPPLGPLPTIWANVLSWPWNGPVSKTALR
jgi:hypothetical protein